MSVFDIKQMARDLLCLKAHHPSAKEVMVERLIEAAVEVVNFPGSHHAELFEGLAEVYELDMGIPRVDAMVTDLADRIRADADSKGWDPRIKVMVRTKKLSNTFHRATICMDLDSTILAEAEHVHTIHAEARRPEITDVVSDNPGAELLDEFDREFSRQSEHRTPLLSDRDSRFVNVDKNRNGGY